MGKHDDTDAELLFKTQIGQRATIQRETVRGDKVKLCNNRLTDLGNFANPLPPGQLEYMGSAAVHIFYNRTLEQFYAINQADTLGKCPQVLAAKAFDDLLQTMRTYYGHKRSVLRSGF